MTNALDQTLGIAILVGSGLLGFLLVGSALIGANLGAQARLEEAAFVGAAGQMPPDAIPGTDARSLLRRTILISLGAPFLSLALAAMAFSTTKGSAPVALVAAEIGLPLALLVMGRGYHAFAARLEREVKAGYSSFDATPFGEPVLGMWTRVHSGQPRPPLPPTGRPRPPLDPMISDALDSTLELSLPLEGVLVPAEPPKLLPGIPAPTWLRWGWLLVFAAWIPWFLVFLPAVIMPFGNLRDALMTGATLVFVTCGPIGVILGLAGRNRARAERAAGYTTLQGRESSMVSLGKFVPSDAWAAFGTDRLWHLDPKSGAVIRPPLDPTWALRDPRVRPPLRRLFARPPRSSTDGKAE